MSGASLADLPLEIQCNILRNLPVVTVLTFARTSLNSYALARTVLTTLHLAVFSKRVHGVLAFLSVANSLDFRAYNTLNEPQLDWLNRPIKIPAADIPPVHGRHSRSHRQRGARADKTINHNNDTSTRQGGPSIPPNLPSPQAYRERQIQHQNAHLSTILSSGAFHNLATLTIHTYALLSPSLASTLSTQLPHLRHLTLNFSHPAVHDPCLPSFYWDSCPALDKEGSTAWNLLAGIGSSSSSSNNRNVKQRTVQQQRRLQTLSIKRAAISSLQLRTWVERNPEMRELRLALVTGVDQAFVEGLAELSLLPTAVDEKEAEEEEEEEEKGEEQEKHAATARRTGLRTLVLEACVKLDLRTREDFAWVEALLGAGLRELSFKDCANVDMDLLKEVNEDRGWTAKGLSIAELEEEVDDLETRSLTHESNVTDKTKTSFIEIDPRFD